MNGIERSRNFFEENRVALLSSVPKEAQEHFAAGLIGEGSECFGFDDALSEDHDFDCGFQIYLPSHIFSVHQVSVQRAYNRLVRDASAQPASAGSAGAGKRRGVFSVPDFYRSLIGCNGVPETLREWLSIPEYALSTAVNGKVFCDNDGSFSAVRTALLKGYPRDVLYKKLSVRLITMAQSGQYNFPRCLARRDYGAATLALHEFVTAAISAVFLLNHRYMPYYKWSLRSMETLPLLGEQTPALRYLLTAGTDAGTADIKAEAVEAFCALLCEQLRTLHISREPGSFLEPHSLCVKEQIENAELKAMHIMQE